MSEDREPRHWLRYWRKARGMSQADLGALLGRDESTVSKWENGSQHFMQHMKQIAQALDIHPVQLISGRKMGPGAPPVGFAEDAVPFKGDIPGVSLKLGRTEMPYLIKTGVLSRARSDRHLAQGDIAVFDIGARAMREFHDGLLPDGTVVIAQTHDDIDASAKTIVRQWIGDTPGLLITNQAGANEVTNLQQHGEITVMGVLIRSIRSHRAPPPDLRLVPRKD